MALLHLSCPTWALGLLPACILPTHALNPTRNSVPRGSHYNGDNPHADSAQGLFVKASDGVDEHPDPGVRAYVFTFG